MLITVLCTLSGLSERVSYNDYAAGCKVRVLDPRRDMRFFSSLKCPDRLWDLSASYSNGTGFFPGGKVAGAWN